MHCRTALCSILVLATAVSSHAQWVKTGVPDSVRALTYGRVALEGGGTAVALFAGTISGVYRSTDNGMNWVAVNGGLTNTSVRALAIFRDTIFAGTVGGGIFRSVNGGTNWIALNTGLTNLNVRAILIYGTEFYLGTAGGGVFRSTNRGANWTAISIGSTGTAVNALEFYSGTLYAGTGGGWHFPHGGRRYDMGRG
jgi:photosystem II stability/assembly factor-like uncharacterized protein